MVKGRNQKSSPGEKTLLSGDEELCRRDLEFISGLILLLEESSHGAKRKKITKKVAEKSSKPEKVAKVPPPAIKEAPKPAIRVETPPQAPEPHPRRDSLTDLIEKNPEMKGYYEDMKELRKQKLLKQFNLCNTINQPQDFKSRYRQAMSKRCCLAISIAYNIYSQTHGNGDPTLTARRMLKSQILGDLSER